MFGSSAAIDDTFWARIRFGKLETCVHHGGEKPVFIDAFAGCGGLSLGLLRSGWKGLFAIEKDAFAFNTLRANLIDPGARLRYEWPSWLDQSPSTIESIVESHGERLRDLRGKIDLLAGGPPCQGFSSAGRRKPDDPRNQLVERYLEFVEMVRPRMVLIENVGGITADFVADEFGDSDGPGRRNFASDLISKLGANYHVYTDVILCSEYGIPQRRSRFFLIGMLKTDMKKLTRGDDPFSRLRSGKTRFLDQRGLRSRVSCRQAISDLERGNSAIGVCPDSKGYEAIVGIKPRTNFQRLMRDGFEGQVPDTRLAKHRPHIVERFGSIIAECAEAGRLNVALNREMRARYGLNKMATRVLDPDKPAPTITSMPDDLLHYSEPRTLTVRENARLQTFPDWFAFQGNYTTGGQQRAREVPRFTQVANAVPPLIAEMWGEVLLKYELSRRQSARTSIAA